MGSIMNKYAPIPTNYYDEFNWLAFYDRGCDIDTFYLYPTMGHTNPRDAFCAASDMTMRRITLDVAPTQLLPFMWETNVYAPFYRQAGFSALKPLLESNASNRKEAIEGVEQFFREEAMEDIYAALDCFFKYQNHGKPFFIVAHSQGSALMKVVLEDYRAQHPEYFESMIAAYCPGWTFTQEWCDKVGLPFSQGPTDTGVLVSWNAEWPSEPDDFNVCSYPTALCTNPITWNSSTTPTSLSKSLGTLVLNATAIAALEREIFLAFSEELGFTDKEDVDDKELRSRASSEEFVDATYELMGALWYDSLWAGPASLDALGKLASKKSNTGKVEDIPFAIKPGFVSVCVNPARGTLSVEYPETNNLTPNALGKKSLHMLEYPLFFEDIHRNVCDRIEAWRASGHASWLS